MLKESKYNSRDSQSLSQFQMKSEFVDQKRPTMKLAMVDFRTTNAY